MNGFEAVKRIRIWEAEGRLPRQAVIALTGNARQWQIDQAKEAGMDHGKSSYNALRPR
jgi:CheY-like chemotaxis protein